MAKLFTPIRTQALAVTVLALGVDYVTRKALRQSWRYVAHSDPPLNPASRETDWKEALAWTIVVGVTVGVVRLAATRYATAMLASGDDSIDDDSLATATEAESVV